MTRNLHIVSLVAPSPPDFGGVMDLYYKIPALHQLGWNITLHYFDYRKDRDAAGLEAYCRAIHSYPRGSFVTSLLRGESYVVGSRVNRELVRRLHQDNDPVLLEGIHCTGILSQLQQGRSVVLRLHNDEAVYYEHLRRSETSALRRLYYRREQRLLARVQERLPRNIPVAAVADTDTAVFRDRYGYSDVHFIPCFLPWQQVNAQPGKGSFCLYQGNLEISENREAVRWLAEAVFSQVSFPLVIAGKDAGRMEKEFSRYANIRLVSDPSDAALTDLIRSAHINILPSMNMTGVKLKLLHALFQGRFCITNKMGVLGSGVENAVVACDPASEMIGMISSLFGREFTMDDISLRRQALALYNNEVNAEKLSALWSHYP